MKTQSTYIDNLIRLVCNKQITTANLAQILKHANISPKQFAKLISQSARNAD